MRQAKTQAETGGSQGRNGEMRVYSEEIRCRDGQNMGQAATDSPLATTTISCLQSRSHLRRSMEATA